MKIQRKTATAREASFHILLQFATRTKRLDELIRHEFETSGLSDRDKKMIVTLTHGVVKNLTLLDWRLTAVYHGDWQKALHKLKTIMRLAAYEIDFLDFIPPHATINEYVNLAKKCIFKNSGNVVNGVMRNYLRRRKQLDPDKRFKHPETQIELKYSVPQWLVQRWIHLWGIEHTAKMCAAFNTRPLFDLKINLNIIRLEEFEQILVENGITFMRSDYFPDLIKLSDIQTVRNLKLFKKGYCLVQDESARLAVEMLELHKGEKVLDACAAPGGKIRVMHQLMADSILTVGMDIDRRRIKFLRENFAGMSCLSTCRVVQGDGRQPPFKGEFDKILVDAPCSGLGTLQKNPDIKWRRTLEDIYSFQRLQIDILNGICELLADNGVMVYSTCTIDPGENEEVVAGFLQHQNGRFKTIRPPLSLRNFWGEDDAIRTFPHIHWMDGAFSIRLARSDAI